MQRFRNVKLVVGNRTFILNPEKRHLGFPEGMGEGSTPCWLCTITESGKQGTAVDYSGLLVLERDFQNAEESAIALAVRMLLKHLREEAP